MEYEGLVILKIKEWLFEYAARFGMTKVLQEIADKHSDLWAMEKCQVNHIFPLLVIYKNMVYFQEVKEYPVAIELMDKLYMQRQHILSISKYVKLQLSLKTMVMFDMLKNDHPDIIGTFNAYFPKSGFVAPKITPKIADKLKPVLTDFRKLFSDLISRPTYRKKYLEEDYENDYGEEFQTKMKKYVNEFVSSMHKGMPPTAIEKILKNPSEIYQFAKQSSNMIGIFLDNLENLEVLDEAKVLKLLELFSLLSEEYNMPSLSSSDIVMDAYSASILHQIENGRPDATDNNDDKMLFAEKKLKSSSEGVDQNSRKDVKADLSTIEECSDSDSDHCAVEESYDNINPSCNKTFSKVTERKNSKKRKRTFSASPDSSMSSSAKKPRIIQEISLCDSDISTSANKSEGLDCSGKEFSVGINNLFQRGKTKGTPKTPKNVLKRKISEDRLNITAAKHGHEGLKKAVVVLEKLSEVDIAKYMKCNGVEENKHSEKLLAYFKDCDELALHLKEIRKRFKGTNKRGPKMTKFKRLLVGLAYSNGLRPQTDKRPSDGARLQILEEEETEEGRPKLKVVNCDEYRVAMSACSQSSSDCQSSVLSVASEPAYESAGFSLMDDGDMLGYLQGIHLSNEEERLKCSPQTKNDLTILKKKRKRRTKNASLSKSEVMGKSSGRIADVLAAVTIADEVFDKDDLQNIQAVDTQAVDDVSPDVTNDSPVTDDDMNPRGVKSGPGEKEISDIAILKDETMLDLLISNNSEKTDDDRPGVEHPVEDLHDKTPENRAEDMDQSDLEDSCPSPLLIDFTNDPVAERADKSENECELPSSGTTDEIGKDCISDPTSQPAATQFYSPPSTGTLLHVAQPSISSVVARHLSHNSSDSFHSCDGPSEPAAEEGEDFQLSDLITDDEHDLYGDMLDDASSVSENFYDKLVESDPGKDSNVSIRNHIKEFDIKLYKTDIFIETEEGHRCTIFK